MSKKAKLIVGLFVLLSFSLILAGCGEKTVATVNGQKITQKQLDQQLDVFGKQNGVDLKDPKFAAMAEPFKKQVLDQLVQNALIMQEAEKRKIKVTDKDVNAEIEKIIKDYFQGDKKQFDEAIKQMGMTEQFLKKDIESGLIANKLVEQVTSEAKITDAAIEKYYNDNKGQFLQVEASHILVKNEEDAKGIITQLKTVDSGKVADEFAKIAKEKSTDESNKNDGGKLGYFSKGQMVPEFEAAAFGQEIGTISQAPIKTEFGYHIIYVTNKKEKFEDFKADIKKTLENEAVNKYIADLKQKAKIDYKIEFKETPSTGGGMPPASGGGANPHTGPNPEVPLEDGAKK